jgi:hypothetical protein
LRPVHYANGFRGCQETKSCTFDTLFEPNLADYWLFFLWRQQVQDVTQVKPLSPKPVVVITPVVSVTTEVSAAAVVIVVESAMAETPATKVIIIKSSIPKSASATESIV